MENVEAAFEIFENISAEAQKMISKISTEEDAKVHLINRVLFEVLGWPHSWVNYEEAVDSGFIDAKISDGERCYAVLEAKRFGVLKLETANKKKATYKLSGPVLAQCRDPIEQCAKYFQSTGAQIGCVTDGVAWIFFRTYLEGRPYLEGNAVVFPDLTAVAQDFPTFFELLAKPSVFKSYYKIVFDEINSGISNVLLMSDTVIREQDYHVVKKDPIAYDIEQILKRYFSNLSGEDDPDLIVDCFVETRESRIADFSLEKITRSIIGNIAPQSTDIPLELATVIEDAVQYQRGETIFIVGPSGAGKSTFVSRFFKKILPSNVRDRCLLLTLNAVDAKGDREAFMGWMTERLIEQIEAAHFKNGTPTYDELRGLYQGEYLKRSVGIDAPLYNSDREAFKRKFSEVLDSFISNDRTGYLERLLADAINNRKKLPIFVVDNTDEFPPDFREVVYQYFQSLKRACNYALLIFPMTDQTAWSFMKTKIFNVYSSKSYFLPTPSPKEVLRKRIEYLRARSTETSGNHTPAEYFSTQGFKIKIQDIEAFSSAVEDIFINTDFLTNHVGLLANYNIRKTLDLSRRVITSSIFKIDEIIKSYVAGKRITPNYRKFMQALLQGDYSYYRPIENPYIYPVFDVSDRIRYSPLLALRILVLLKQARTKNQAIEEKHWNVSDIVSYFDGAGVAEPATKLVLERLLASDLIEPFDLSDREIYNSQRIAITSKGTAHLDLALFNDMFFAQMLFTTSMNDPEVITELRVAKSARRLGKEAWGAMFRAFARYLLREDGLTCSIPEIDRYNVQWEFTREFESRWIDRKLVSRYAESAAPEYDAVVEWFDRNKGFGFVHVEALRENAFLHVSVLERFGVSQVADGETIKVSTTTGPRGLAVQNIFSIGTGESAERDVLHDGVIVHLVRDRAFGFISSPTLDEDAFFHFTVFDEDQRPRLREGVKVRFGIIGGRDGRAFQVSKISSMAS
ncbi:MAG: cold shock domain-containing protein [Roseibium aggregatum]